MPHCISCARPRSTSSGAYLRRSEMPCKIALGMSSGSAPDRFLVGLAVLSLLSEIAEQQPLVCLVDDEQWLDRASAQVLGFAARRLDAESVGLVFAARVPSSDIAGLPDLVVERLGGHRCASAARCRPDRAVGRSGPRADPCRDSGQPAGIAGAAPWIDSAGASGRIWASQRDAIIRRHEENFRRRVEVLPDQTRRLLLIAAAEPLGDPALVWGAAARLGVGAEATRRRPRRA